MYRLYVLYVQCAYDITGNLCFWENHLLLIGVCESMQ